MKLFLACIVLLAIVVVPLMLIYRRVKNGNKSKKPFVANLVGFFALIVVAAVFCLSQSAEAAEAAADATTAVSGDFSRGMQYIAGALAVGLSGIGGGIAVASSASAAMGAMTENEEIFGKALIFVGLAEGVALYGLLIAFMIIPM